MNFFIHGHSTKFVNAKGITLSLGGDSNCNPENEKMGIRDRLTVIFYDNNGMSVIPDYLEDAEYLGLIENNFISVWNDPQLFVRLLSQHMAQ
jgi:hypothetical protein